ncbi:hypothetical protein [Persicobacter psychrovividus]|uniref:Uncharacterized protein n=1 Tax=Persicobacter psychrovividus TaxID=387638 RepID=A0ABM7VGZ0_9BACT|nr:hypothetical protein PEPS_25220 [Persicobacter psychrovividus]
MKGLFFTLFAILSLSFVTPVFALPMAGTSEEINEDLPPMGKIEMPKTMGKFILIDQDGGIIRCEETLDLQKVNQNPALRPLLKHSFFITEIGGDAFYMLM